MIKTAAILPTGDEIRSGIVLDTDSPEVIRQLVALEPAMEIVRYAPAPDREESIHNKINALAGTVDLIVLIGGSGGGHRFSDTLGKDFTHTAMETLLEKSAKSEIYGKNGHLWCKLVCGWLRQTLVINLPGPFVEAKAAMEAFCKTIESKDISAINEAMVRAILKQYPGKAHLGTAHDHV